MKLLPVAFALLPVVAAAQWSAPGLSVFITEESGLFLSQTTLKKGKIALTLHNDQQCWQPAGVVKLNQPLSLTPCTGNAPE